MGHSLPANYLLSAVRALKRDKLYAAINILGLAVGLAAGLMILIFVKYELSYDKWIPDSERIYRLHTTYDMSRNSTFRSVASSGPMAENLPLSFPEIESIARLSYITANAIIDGAAYSVSITMVDPSFFDVFDLPLVAGYQETALDDVSSIIINETTKQRFFGERPALGETLTLCCIDGTMLDFKVTAVLKDLPENSHLDLQAMILINKPAYRHDPSRFESWTSVNNFTFMKFHPGTDIAAVEGRLPAFIDAKMPSSGPNRRSIGIHLSLMNLQDLHLKAGFQASDIGDMKPPGNLLSVIGFTATAILILLIASINFMNLSTARSSLRAREVSLRKVVGAERSQLLIQFLGESILVTVIAMSLALILAQLALPVLTSFLLLDIGIDLFNAPELVLLLLGAIALVGIISGLYPAVHLSSFQPARVLTSNSNKYGTSLALGGFRAALVVIQFSVTISLLIITGVIFLQTQYAKSVDLGFEREDRLVIRWTGNPSSIVVRDTFINRLLRLPEVSSAVLSSDVPTEHHENNGRFFLSGTNSEQGFILNIVSIDYGFMEAYGIGLLAGRDLSKQYNNDNVVLPADQGVVQSASALVNDSAMRQLGFSSPNEILGRTLHTESLLDGSVDLRIVGVIPDIQMRSIRYDNRPTIYFRNDTRLDNLTVALDGMNVQVFVDKVKALWGGAYPLTPFNYTFVDDLINSQYAEEDRQSAVFLFFTALAVLVAFLGLFGLASFVIVQRTREVGIRKVLGAEVPDIVNLMLWQFSKPVLMATIIAWPVAWFICHRWLQGFELRISAFNPFIYSGATIAALAVAWITVATHMYRAARTRPTDALRD